MNEPSKSGFLLPVIVTLTMLLGLYVGAYYAMVYPYNGFSLYPARHNGTTSWGQRPVWERFFAPINWLDRRIRPHVWEPPR